jgi:hypothetical protein
MRSPFAYCIHPTAAVVTDEGLLAFVYSPSPDSKLPFSNCPSVATAVNDTIKTTPARQKNLIIAVSYHLALWLPAS